MAGSDKIYPDVCAEIGAGGGFMCYRWCYSLCWWCVCWEQYRWWFHVLVPFVLMTYVLRVRAVQVVLCVTCGVTLCAGDVCSQNGADGGFICYRWCYLLCWWPVCWERWYRWWFHELHVVLPFVLVTCVLRVVVQVVVSCVTGGVTFCVGDLCAESSTGGDQSPSPCSHAACATHDRLHGAGQYQFTIQAKNPFWCVWHFTCPLTPPCLCRTGTSMRLSLSTSDMLNIFETCVTSRWRKWFMETSPTITVTGQIHGRLY